MYKNTRLVALDRRIQANPVNSNAFLIKTISLLSRHLMNLAAFSVLRRPEAALSFFWSRFSFLSISFQSFRCSLLFRITGSTAFESCPLSLFSDEFSAIFHCAEESSSKHLNWSIYAEPSQLERLNWRIYTKDAYPRRSSVGQANLVHKKQRTKAFHE